VSEPKPPTSPQIVPVQAVVTLLFRALMITTGLNAAEALDFANRMYTQSAIASLLAKTPGLEAQMKVQAAGIAPVMDDVLGASGLTFSGGSYNSSRRASGTCSASRSRTSAAAASTACTPTCPSPSCCSTWRPRSEP
jgi:hypothetical protein